MRLTHRQVGVLALLTLVWRLNWPVMKVGASLYPPLTFRSLSIWLGLPVPAGALLALRIPVSNRA